MCVLEDVIKLHKKMESEIIEIHRGESENANQSRESAGLIRQYVDKLYMMVSKHPFQRPADEIYFFKILKPKFTSKLIFHQKLYDIEMKRPEGDLVDFQHYLTNELQQIEKYFRDNEAFYRYFKTKSESSDHKYFLRDEQKSWLLLDFEEFDTGLNFTTIYDHRLAKFIAYELLKEILEFSLNKIKVRLRIAGHTDANPDNPLKWTASKVSLVELIYALQSSGACNNGTLELKQLAHQFETIFNVSLGNYYRTFQEMRIRKQSRTTYLDLLKERLIQRMDEQDENPKFRY